MKSVSPVLRFIIVAVMAVFAASIAASIAAMHFVGAYL